MTTILYGDGEHDDTEAMDAVLWERQKIRCRVGGWLDGSSDVIVFPPGRYRRTTPLRIRGLAFQKVEAYGAIVILPCNVTNLLRLESCYKSSIAGWQFEAEGGEGFDIDFNVPDGRYTSPDFRKH